jgi:hypothetical protein
VLPTRLATSQAPPASFRRRPSGGTALQVDGAPTGAIRNFLGVYLLRVTLLTSDPARPFEVEFRVLNTGLAPIELLASLQLQLENFAEAI